MQRKPNYYDAQRHDRMAHFRKRDALLDQHVSEQSAVFVVIHEALHPVQESSLGVEPVFFTVTELEVFSDNYYDLKDAIFLSRLEGINYWAIEIKGEEAAQASPYPFRDLREFGALLHPENAGILAYARGMIHWHNHHGFCGKCGSPTRPEDQGHVRHCTNDACGKTHFPRTDPAVIMLVHDDEDRILLATQAGWGNRYSVLAGFVEPGESLETAVKREVFEEVGLEVVDIHYHSSQPWPFPSSLMVGFSARVKGRGGIVKLEDDEIVHAEWHHRDSLVDHVDNPDFILARKDSIARSLIDDWISEKK